MRGPAYSEDQLLALKESPLVRKPDGLPEISQWMEVPADQGNNAQVNNNGTARRTRGAREGEAGALNEARPAVNPMGQFGRRHSMQPGEDTVLGPPKLAFASASRATAKATGDTKTGIISTDGDNLGDRFPREKNDRWTRDRDVDRTRDKGFANGRRVPREDGEGWTNVKGRKSIGQEDFERFNRNGNGDRTREKAEGELEADGSHRRTNRERAEPRWGRRDDAKEDTTKPGLQGGWRERDRDRERDRERDWTRGGNARAEDEPEWLDTKVEKKESKAHTQEEFQRWKEQMRAKDTPGKDRDDVRDTPLDKPTATGATVPPMLTQALQTPTGAEPTQGILFGNWGRDTGADIPPPETTTTKPRQDKKSRFMTMFAKAEEPVAPSQPPAPLPASPAPVMEANADKEGFQRILQMLGQVNVGGPTPPQPNMPTHTNGARHGGGVSLDFIQQSPPPEPQHNRPPPRTVEQQGILDSILAPRTAMPDQRMPQQSRFSSMSPENAHPEQFRIPRPESGHLEDHFPHQPPPQRHTPQDANLAAMLSNRTREESHRDQATKQRERDFLLTLMQQPTRATPPMHNHIANRAPQDNHNMAFFDQPRQQPQQQPPKGRGGLPPGFMEDPRMYNDNENLRRENERREQELRQQLNMQQQQQEAMRAKNARMPMGFPGHDDPLMGLQRRNTGGDPRLTTNMGIPSQPVPDMPYMGGRGQQGMPPTPQERANIAPPPGFGAPMRQPPGLSGPGPQQIGPGGPSFSAGNTPLGHPPGFPPPGANMRGMGFPGGPGGPAVNGMPGPPQGYFPPPGYGPPMPGMRGEDPRMMFESQYGGPGPRQPQGRPGPPNMY